MAEKGVSGQKLMKDGENTPREKAEPGDREVMEGRLTIEYLGEK